MAESFPVFHSHLPTLAGSGDKRQSNSFVFTAAASIATSWAAIAEDPGQLLLLFPTVLCHLVSGDVNVGAPVVATAWPIPPGQYARYWLPKAHTHFRIIGNTAGGTLYWAFL